MRSATFHGFVLALPLLVAAGFWLAAALERRRRGSTASFIRRNGAAVAGYLLLATGVWMALLIVLPLLTWSNCRSAPSCRRSQRGGPRDIYTLANYRYFLFGNGFDASGWNVLHLRAFATTIFVSVGVTLRRFRCCAIRWPMPWRSRPARSACGCCC